MATTFTVRNHSSAEPCLCGEMETVEVTGGNNLRARLCGACLLFFIARAEGNGRNTGPMRGRGRSKPSRQADAADGSEATSNESATVPMADLLSGDRDPAKAG